MRRAAKVDANQEQVVSALRSAGATVQSLAAIGRGTPDLLVAHGGLMYLMEVKDGAKVKSAQSLTPDQVRWHAAWGAKVYVVRSAEDALRVIGVIHAEQEQA